MTHEWDRGVLSASSWHGLETVGTMADAAAMIHAGEHSGAWPCSLRSEGLRTAAGLDARCAAIVASYHNHENRVLGVNGSRYTATAPDAWRELCRAAVDAGAQPTGAFALRGASRVLATFEVGTNNGLRTNLLIADSFDGSLKLTCGFATIRVVCANTLAVALSEDGAGMAALRHTASLAAKTEALRGAIGKSIASGEKVKATFAAAAKTPTTRDMARVAFDALFPLPPADAQQSAQTRAANERIAARTAALMPINRVGENPGNLATLWNAATYLVDRRADGTFRDSRSGNELDSLLFGARAERLAEIQHTIEIVMRDGTIAKVHGSDAIAMGVEPRQVGAAVLGDMVSALD